MVDKFNTFFQRGHINQHDRDEVSNFWLNILEEELKKQREEIREGIEEMYTYTVEEINLMSDILSDGKTDLLHKTTIINVLNKTNEQNKRNIFYRTQ